MALYEQHCLTETSPQLLAEEQLNLHLIVQLMSKQEFTA